MDNKRLNNSIPFSKLLINKKKIEDKKIPLFNHRHLQYIPIISEQNKKYYNYNNKNMSNSHSHQLSSSSTTSTIPMQTKSIGVGTNLNYSRNQSQIYQNNPKNQSSSSSHQHNQQQHHIYNNNNTSVGIGLIPRNPYHHHQQSSESYSNSTSTSNQYNNNDNGLIESKEKFPNVLSNAQINILHNLKSNQQKIVSQNLNGTLSVTGVPCNDSELQLFRVLQRGNLLNYFDIMIELGGDDVQQLCEAGEEEFLEIMALIGMASKPLHVRRLQKSLQEFITTPNLFPGPILGPPLSSFTNSNSNSSSTSQQLSPISLYSNSNSINQTISPSINKNKFNNISNQQQTPIRPIPITPNTTSNSSSLTGFTLSNGIQIQYPSTSIKHIHQHIQNQHLNKFQIERIIDSVNKIINTLPTKLKIKNREDKSETDDEIGKEKEERIRNLCKIYIEYNSKRKGTTKTLTINEILTNEAAYQLCSKVPNLLNQKEELKLLSKEVLRICGLTNSNNEFYTEEDTKRPNSAPNTSNTQENNNNIDYKQRPESSPIPNTNISIINRKRVGDTITKEENEIIYKGIKLNEEPNDLTIHNKNNNIKYE